MNDTTIAVFALAALATTATPGPTALLALANGSRHGLGGSLPGVAGALLSDVVLILAVTLGLDRLLAATELALPTLRLAGLLYLAWVGLGMLRQQTGPQPASPARTTETAWSRLRRALLVALGNPKGLLFFAALLPPFIDPASPHAPQVLTLGVVFVLIDAVVLLVYAGTGASCARRVGQRIVPGLERACGAGLLTLAGALALGRIRS